MKKIVISLVGLIILSIGIYSCTKDRQTDSEYKTKIESIQIPKSSLGLNTRKVDWFKVVKMAGTDIAVGYGIKGIAAIPVVGPYLWVFGTFGSSFAAAGRIRKVDNNGNFITPNYFKIDLDTLHSEIALYSIIHNPYRYLGENHNILLNEFAGMDSLFDADGHLIIEAKLKLQNVSLDQMNTADFLSAVIQYEQVLNEKIQMAKDNFNYYNEPSFQNTLTENEKVLLNQTMQYLEPLSNSLTISNLTTYIDNLEAATINSNLSDSEKENNLKYLAGLNYSMAYWIKQNEN